VTNLDFEALMAATFALKSTFTVAAFALGF
jgi:hypothetical protein